MVTLSSQEPLEEHLNYTIPGFSYTGPFEKGLSIAEHYGFSIIKPSDKAVTPSKKIALEPAHKDASHHYVALEEKLGALGIYLKHKDVWPKPALVAYGLYPRKKVGKIKLAVYGCRKSIAEAILMKTALTILEESGYQDFQIDLNSLGYGDSRSEFVREYINYFRGHVNNMTAPTQTVFKNDPLHITLCDEDSCRPLREDAPHSLSFLCEEGRNHFREILEYVESMNVPYRLNPHLLGYSTHPSETLFQIKKKSKNKDGSIKETIIARGERNDTLYKLFGLRKEIPFVSMTLDIKPAQKPEKYSRRNEQGIPSIYFVHLGMVAKQRVLEILEILRKKNISVMQTVTHSTLGLQMNRARALGVPYTMIMGLKEAQENVVILRDMATRSQKTIPIDKLPLYLKRVTKTLG